MLVAFGLQFSLIGLAAGVILFARWSGRVWAIAAIFLALDAIMLWVYRATLEGFTRLAARQQEVLTAQLCR